MYNVMVVDDEKAIRDNLAHVLPFEEHGFKVIETAKNGKEAFDKVSTIRPDLIFLDVNMPVMNGLQFLELLRASEFKDVKVVMLSGYNDFEYARKAIQYDVKAYLTKPIDEEDGLNILLKVHDELLERNQRKEPSKILKDVEYYNRLYVGGALDRTKLKDYVVINFAVLNQKVFSKGEHAQDIIEQLMANQFEEGLYSHIRTRGSLVTFILHRKAIKSHYDGYEICGKKLCCKLKKVGLDSAVLIDMAIFSTTTKNFREDFTDHLFHMLSQVFFLQETYCQWGEHSQRRIYAELESKRLLLEHFKHNLLAMNFMKVLDDFEALAEDIYQQFFGIEYVYEISFRLYYLMVDILDELGELKEEVSIDFPNWQEAQFFECFEQWREREMKGIKTMIAVVKNKRATINQGPSQEIINYIHCHYKEPLTIKTIAEYFHLNPAYVGRIFKQTLGISMKQYINDMRIEESKKMLLNTEKLIYEIAEEVGFTESKYMVSKFTSSVGVSPLQFRKGNRHV